MVMCLHAEAVMRDRAQVRQAPRFTLRMPKGEGAGGCRYRRDGSVTITIFSYIHFIQKTIHACFGLAFGTIYLILFK